MASSEYYLLDFKSGVGLLDLYQSAMTIENSLHLLNIVRKLQVLVQKPPLGMDDLHSLRNVNEIGCNKSLGRWFEAWPLV